MKDIPGYEGLYAITKTGKVWSYPPKRNHPLKGMYMSVNKSGRYHFIALFKNGTFFNGLIHRLLAQTYIPNPLNLPQVNHINGIKTDNRLKNLEWVTSQKNVIHANKLGLIAHQKGSKHHHSKLTEEQVQSLRLEYKKGNVQQKDLAARYGVSRSAICNIISKKQWTHI
jgi:hypothetical protein